MMEERMENINVWFSYDSNDIKSHARYKKYANIIVYKYKIEATKYMDFLCDKLNWILILSSKKFWLWKPAEESLLELDIKDIRLFLGYPHYQRGNEFNFECTSEIIENYLISPFNIKDIVKILNIQRLSKRIEIEKKLAIEDKFYIASWVQNI